MGQMRGNAQSLPLGYVKFASYFYMRLIVKPFKLFGICFLERRQTFIQCLTGEKNETLMGRHALLVCSHHNIKHLMTGREGNSLFCSPRISRLGKH